MPSSFFLLLAAHTHTTAHTLLLLFIAFSTGLIYSVLPLLVAVAVMIAHFVWRLWVFN